MNGWEYNFLMKFLHRLVLGSKAVLELSFEIEQALFKKGDQEHSHKSDHVFISGLARCGSTALLNAFYSTGQFASLTYDDMPFALAPNTWEKLKNKRPPSALTERAHKDGLYINNHSPEALEEVFWKVFLEDQYIGKKSLAINFISESVLQKFEDYVHLIIKKQQKNTSLRYLSKNNNNVLRFLALQKKFPTAYFIVPYRDPLQHALSLVHQHENFSNLQEKNKFVLHYMNWIGHHEFGLNQKSFSLKDSELFASIQNLPNTDINYWLATWLNYYSYVLEHFSDKCILLSYERFCEHPVNVLTQLFQAVSLANFEVDLQPFNLVKRNTSSAKDALLKRCYAIYAGLEEKALIRTRA